MSPDTETRLLRDIRMNRCGCVCTRASFLLRKPRASDATMNSSMNISCVRAPCRRRGNPLPTMLLTLLILHCYHLCSSHRTRPCRTRRRNNTGFYYGLRDDDMNFFRDGWPLRWDVSSKGKSVQSSLFGSKIDIQLSEDGQHETRHDKRLDTLQYFTRGHSSTESSQGNICQSLNTKRQKFMQSFSQTLMESLMLPLPHRVPDNRMGHVTTRHRRKTNRILCSIQNRSIFPDVTTHQASTLQQGDINIVRTASIVKSKPKTQPKKKRRKNNTGFYYGIREDVLFLPERSVADEKKVTVPNGKIFDMGDTQGQLPRSPVDNDESVIEKFDDRASFKEPDLMRENLAEQEKLHDQKEEIPSIKHAPTIQLQSPDFDESNYGKDNKRQSSVPQQTLLPSDLDGGTKKNKKNKHQITKKQQRIEPLPHQPVPSISSTIFDETIQELRQMRHEIFALREELRSLKGKFRECEEAGETAPSSDLSSKDTEKSRWWHRPPPKESIIDPERITEVEQESPTLSPLEPTEKEDEQQPSPLSSFQQTAPKLSRVARRREFEKIGRNVESWACRLLFEEKDKEEDGWKKIACNNFVRKKFNPDGRTQVYLKWMPDSRYDNNDVADESHVDSSKINEQHDYPCIKCYSVIDAPMDKVCSFLANEKTIPMYNELVDDHCDIEEITPHSKITWCKMPKVMFVKPRDFVTYCSHRWWKDGTQVIINQACEHEDMPGVLVEGEGDVCRGYALRGANFISKDPDDPNKTRITMLAHANPGGGLPHWAMSTAVNAVVQIEPFKLFHNINEGVSKYIEPPPSISPSHQLASINSLPGRSNRPAGLAQMGYACFWPKGGGLKEKHSEQLEEDDEGFIPAE